MVLIEIDKMEQKIKDLESDLASFKERVIQVLQNHNLWKKFDGHWHAKSAGEVVSEIVQIVDNL